MAALSFEEFRLRVREALRTLDDTFALSRNPLIQARVVRASKAPDASPQELAAELGALLRQEAEALRHHERGKWFRVLEAAYLEPQGKHESAAAMLGLSYATFRRYLNAATERLTAALWERELGVGRRGGH